jgi:hypothetical protein
MVATNANCDDVGRGGSVSTALTGAPTIRLLCWNMGVGGPGQKASWTDVRDQQGIDAALLQEAPNPWRSAVDLDIVPSPGSKWGIGSNRAQTAVARLSDRVVISALMMQPLGLDGPLQLGISRPGTLTVAKLTVLDTSEVIMLASIYAQWEGPISGGPGGFADASMHRILSDLSPLLSWRDHPIIVAGDFNNVLGTHVEGIYGANWNARTAGVFSRMGDLGLRLAGPQAPNGNLADPRPPGLPVDTKNVPTFVTNRGNRTSQLDYCFVSEDLVDRVSVVARNDIDDWGPSDHCRLTIDIEPPRERIWNERSLLAEVGASSGRDSVLVAADMFEWARNHQLRLEFGTGPEGVCGLQLDGGPDGTQFTFVIRTRGDVTLQFRWMKDPFTTPASREALRQEILEAVPLAEIPPDRINGLPSIPLRLLTDPDVRSAFLEVFSRQVAHTRQATELPLAALAHPYLHIEELPEP